MPFMSMTFHSLHTQVLQHSHTIRETAPLLHPVFPHLYNSEQTNLPSSNHTYTVKSHPSPLCPLCNTHTISSTVPTYAPHCHPWICGQNLLEWWSCWPDGGISWLVDQKRDDWTPPTNKCHGSDRQQQPHCHPWICGQTSRGDSTPGQMDGEACWWTTSGKIGLPPLARVMGMGNQQQ